MKCPNCQTINVPNTSKCITCGRRLVGADAVLALDKKTGRPIGSIIGLGVSVLYMLNPTAGFDFLPDILPLVGNLDEMGATILLLRSGANLGLWMFGSDQSSMQKEVLQPEKSHLPDTNIIVEQTKNANFVPDVQTSADISSDQTQSPKLTPQPKLEEGKSGVELIRELQQLKDDGLLTDDEFEAKKTELLKRL